MAAAMLGAENPWDAGQALMSRGSPDSFAQMVRLYRACDGKPVELCEAAISVRTIQEAPAPQVRR
jgi:hypothetical protein